MNNENILNEFAYLSNYHKLKGEYYKQRVYENAINTIKKINIPIHSSEQLKGIYGIGPKTLEKIDEIIKHGKLKNEEFKNEVMSIKELTSIRGIGISKAKKLYHSGIKTVQDLKRSNYSDLLTTGQIIGLKYHEHLKEKIPRNISELIVKSFKKIFKDKYSFELLGSYRRKQDLSGDIDLLINDHKTGNMVNLIPIVNTLIENDIIVETFGLKEHFFSGILKFGNSFYNLDLKTYPKKEHPFAILYFTGPRKFNIMMRKYAKKHGYKLSDHGLYDIFNKVFIECKTEKDIFNSLGLKYVNPEDRE